MECLRDTEVNAVAQKVDTLQLVLKKVSSKPADTRRSSITYKLHFYAIYTSMCAASTRESGITTSGSFSFLSAIATSQ